MIQNSEFKNLYETSHDIKTSINEIIGISNIMKKTNLTKQQMEYINIITNCSVHLNNLTNNILEYSKCSEGKIKLKNDLFDLEKCINECYDNIKTNASSKKINLFYKINDNVPQFLISDKLYIQQILINLLSNACKFTDKGYIYINVSCNIKSEEISDIEFSIEDTGIGIPEKRIFNIFNSFNRIDNGNKYKGIGLGLSICKNLVKLFEGNISAESDSNGSIFKFNILTKYKFDKKKDYTEFIDKKILIVDKNIKSRMNYFQMFYKWKMKPQSCINCNEAIQLLKECVFDFIFIDEGINDLCYIKLMSEIEELNKDIKIIISISITDKYPISKKITLLTKPISNSILYKSLKSI